MRVRVTAGMFEGMTGTRTSLRDQHGHVGVLLTCHGIVRYIDPAWIADELPSPPVSAADFIKWSAQREDIAA